jgi:hypothetical protein
VRNVQTTSRMQLVGLWSLFCFWDCPLALRINNNTMASVRRVNSTTKSFSHERLVVVAVVHTASGLGELRPLAEVDAGDYPAATRYPRIAESNTTQTHFCFFRVQLHGKVG